ncbi:MAG: MFS transporter [Firmicutes bacterium]|nr:MFS transporter [Bacillota bacterium]
MSKKPDNLMGSTQNMLKFPAKVSYGSAYLGYGMVAQTLTTFLMFFGTSVLGIRGTLMGLMFFIIIMWDAVTDPIVGYMSDHTKNRLLGRRHLYILTGVFTTAIINIFIWNVPSVNFSEMQMVIWLLICVCLFQLMSTAYSTPLFALGVELSGNSRERASMESVRTVFFLIGMIAPTVLMGFLAAPHTHVDYYGNVVDGTLTVFPYIELAYIAATVSVALGVLCFFGTYSHMPRLQAKQRMEEITGNKAEKKTITGIFVDFGRTLKKPNHRAVIMGYSATLIAAAILTSVGFHIFTFAFQIPDLMFFVMGALFVTTIFSQPVWVLAVRRWEKRSVLRVGIIICFIGIVLFTFVFFAHMYGMLPPVLDDRGWNIVLFLVPAMLVIGFGVGSLFMVPNAMMGDVITFEKGETGIEKTATYSSFMTLAYKVAQSVAVLIVGVMLDLIRFDSGEPGQPPPIQSFGTQIGLGLIAIVGITVVLIAGARLYAQYTLTRKDLEKFERQLAAQFFSEDGDTMISLSKIKNLAVVAQARRKTADQNDRGVLDLKDQYATHYAVFRDEKVLASGRLFKEGNEIIIDSVYVVPEERDKNYDDMLSRKLISIASDLALQEEIRAINKAYKTRRGKTKQQLENENKFFVSVNINGEAENLAPQQDYFRNFGFALVSNNKLRAHHTQVQLQSACKK